CDRAVWMDSGRVRRDGNTSEVLAAYETAMFAADSNSEGTRKTSEGAKFLRWSISGAGDKGHGTRDGREHILTTTGRFRVEFVLEVRRRIQNGEHGIALYNGERQLMWGWAAPGLGLGAGIHTLAHEFPSLPLRPGSYQL